MTLDIPHFKAKLEAELKAIEEQMTLIGKANPEHMGEWDASKGDEDPIPGDRSEVADSLETLEENTGIVNELEPQLRNIRIALEKIEKGTYGICEVSGEPIEIERLEANPSARTNKAHLND